MIENMFELLVILMALLHSRFARLPLMVACNIIAYAGVTSLIEYTYEVSISPGYEIYYASGSLYFIIMAAIFFSVKNKFYAFVGLVLTIQSAASAVMLMTDGFYFWHDVINDKMLLVECVLVWLSSVMSERQLCSKSK